MFRWTLPTKQRSNFQTDTKDIENARRANPLKVKEQYEKKIREVQAACGEAMLHLRVLKISKPAGGRR